MGRTFAIRKSNNKDDNPYGQFMEGSVSVAVGTLAVVFAKRSYGRTLREITTINKLWK